MASTEDKSKTPTAARRIVQVDGDVYDEIRRLAHADDRPIARYVNRVLRQHVERATGRKVGQ